MTLVTVGACTMPEVVAAAICKPMVGSDAELRLSGATPLFPVWRLLSELDPRLAVRRS